MVWVSTSVGTTSVSSIEMIVCAVLLVDLCVEGDRGSFDGKAAVY